jgi:hypothetical protein
MRRIRDAVMITVLLGTLAQPLCAAVATPREQVLDEAVVQATRLQLRQMRMQMVELEDRFHERYNALNGRDDYDIHCAEETTAGTRMQRRHCRPVFEARAIETEAIDYFLMLQKTTNPGAPMPAGSIGPPEPAIVAIEAQRPDFRRNMIAVTTSNPELLDLLKERDKLAKRYEAAKRKAAKKKIAEEPEAAGAGAIP